MKDRVYFGTNTKMYQTAAQTVEYLRRLEERTRDLADGIAQRFDPFVYRPVSSAAAD